MLCSTFLVRFWLMGASETLKIVLNSASWIWKLISSYENVQANIEIIIPNPVVFWCSPQSLAALEYSETNICSEFNNFNKLYTYHAKSNYFKLNIYLYPKTSQAEHFRPKSCLFFILDFYFFLVLLIFFWFFILYFSIFTFFLFFDICIFLFFDQTLLTSFQVIEEMTKTLGYYVIYTICEE